MGDRVFSSASLFTVITVDGAALQRSLKAFQERTGGVSLRSLWGCTVLSSGSSCFRYVGVGVKLEDCVKG